MPPKPLPTTYTQASLTMTLIHQEDDLVIYSANPKDPNSYHETFRVQHRKPTLLPSGKTRTPGAYPPSSSQWGTDGFSYSKNSSSKKTARELAYQKLRSLQISRNPPPGTTFTPSQLP